MTETRHPSLDANDSKLGPAALPDAILSGCTAAFAAAGLSSSTAMVGHSAFHGRYMDPQFSVYFAIVMTIMGGGVGFVYGVLLQLINRRRPFRLRPRWFFYSTQIVAALLMLSVAELTRQTGRVLSGPLIWVVFAFSTIAVTIACSTRTKESAHDE